VTVSSFLHLALIGVLALSISGCGRKGALDPPPGSSAQQGVPQMQTDYRRAPVDPANPSQPLEPGQPGQGGQLGLTEDEYGNPVVSRGRKKPFLLDPILN
jgi:predicted small lipoprotein YifL